jgi:hypothetical protein
MVDPKVEGIPHILSSSCVAESPLGRVPKQNPDRTISSEGRPISDMRRQNEQGSKFNRPPAPQPRRAAVARQLWWSARRPGIPQRCAKRDVPRAFKWHFLRATDVPEFAVRLAGILLISLVVPFGWVGAPGEFVAWSMAARHHHGSFRPPAPEYNDVVPYDSKWLMDDGVVLEPLVGNRVYHSLSCLDDTMRAVWDPQGVNVEKMAEEGEPSRCQLLWGLRMDFESFLVSLPEPKRIKAKYLLADPGLRRGEKRLPLKLAQEVTGCAQYWSVVCPELSPHLPALYAMLQPQTISKEPLPTEENLPDAPRLVDLPPTSPCWEVFWDTLDFIRLQFERPVRPRGGGYRQGTSSRPTCARPCPSFPMAYERGGYAGREASGSQPRGPCGGAP